MCLGIPGQIVEILDEDIYLAKAEVGGVRRNINIGLVHYDEQKIVPGDWVLIHVGFAMSKLEGDDALCEDAAGNRARIAVELVAPVQTGEVLLTHGGVAIGRVAAQEEEI